MKKQVNSFWIILLFSGFCGFSYGQSEERPKLHLTQELGLNVTNMITRLFRAAPDSANLNPFLLSYRVGSARFGARLGAGGSSSFTEKKEDGFRDSETLRKSAFDARFGVEYRKTFGKRFSGNFALDAIRKWRFDEQVNDSGFDVIRQTTQFQAWGGGPSIGLYFWINPHLGLYTEANFYMLIGKTESARNFENFPELNDKLANERTETFTASLPSSVFLIYRF